MTIVCVVTEIKIVMTSYISTLCIHVDMNTRTKLLCHVSNTFWGNFTARILLATLSYWQKTFYLLYRTQLQLLYLLWPCYVIVHLRWNISFDKCQCDTAARCLTVVWSPINKEILFLQLQLTMAALLHCIAQDILSILTLSFLHHEVHAATWIDRVYDN